MHVRHVNRDKEERAGCTNSGKRSGLETGAGESSAYTWDLRL